MHPEEVEVKVVVPTIIAEYLVLVKMGIVNGCIVTRVNQLLLESVVMDKNINVLAMPVRMHVVMLKEKIEKFPY